jgi:hypothetical protein
VDHDLRPVVPSDRDDCEQVPSTLGIEVQHLAVVLLPDRERVLDGVDGVVSATPCLRAER